MNLKRYLYQVIKMIRLSCKCGFSILRGAIFWKDGCSLLIWGRLDSRIFRQVGGVLIFIESGLLLLQILGTKYHGVPLFAHIRPKKVIVSLKPCSSPQSRWSRVSSIHSISIYSPAL